MSEDLKTLKDIDEFILVKETQRLASKGNKTASGAWSEKPSWTDQDVCAIFNELRAEAIKWVKHYMKIKADDSDKQVYTIQEHQELFINWIMHFFNIKESELK